MAALFAGLMSGTSMDGIDAALLDLSSSHPVILATHSHPYPARLHEQLEAALALTEPLHADLTALNNEVGECFAAAANALLQKSCVDASTVIAIGSHGQTIRHEPDIATPYSLQIGNPTIIAARTGIDVVADFRRADIEAGGQGAPLAPAFHKAVFETSDENRVALNLGGIANITTLAADASVTVTGFDTGPASTLMDYWVQQHLNTTMDNYGRWAAGGEVDKTLLNNMLADSYFSVAPPKSTGREYFNADWLNSFISASQTPAQSIQTTLCELSAKSIADAVHNYARGTHRVIVCGGGAHNDHLMTRLRANLPDIAVDSAALHGIDPDWVEAAAFAWLAQRRLDEKAGNLPSVTGADRPMLLGDIHRHQVR
jgi:anhydro-N-acetylmuramic acid kinase